MYPAVYSYRQVRTRELELSIITLKNIDCWNGEVYVVGDKPYLPDGFNVKHLSITYDWGKKSRNRHNDEICAYLTARDTVGDFIAMADDIFILKPWKLALLNRGELVDHANSRRKEDIYTTSLRRTSELLRSLNKTTLSHELHIPYLIRASELTEVEHLLPHEREGVLIRSLLGNYFGRESTSSEDVKGKQIDENTVIYSGSDRTFNFNQVERFLCH